MRKIWEIGIGLVLWGAMGACTGTGGDEDFEPSPDEAVRLNFLVGEAVVTRADEKPAVTLQEGVRFRIYAYEKGTDTGINAPKAEGIYTVGGGGTATGDLYLYRGEYDLYLVSYNSANDLPELKAGDKRVTVSNGVDFMHTELKGIVVKPTTVGTHDMTVQLPEAFKRMGANLTVKVKAASVQPISINKLTLNTFHIEGLSSSCTYQLGETTWSAETREEGSRYQVASFTGSPDNYSAGYTSSPFVVFPVDGNSLLEFTINLTVVHSGKELTKDYTATIRKALLPGMKYTLEFILTFYGDIIPADLTLKLYDYNGVELSTDSMGTD